MKYILVTGYPRYDAQMEVISEDDTTVICQNPNNNYPETLSGASAAVTDENTIVACGGYDGKFF